MDDYGRSDGELGNAQRGLYLIGGALLVYQAVRSRSFLTRLAMAAAGTGLAMSALRGQGISEGISQGISNTLRRTGLDTSRLGLGRGGAIRVDTAIVIERPASELYAFWRNFENLPRIMDNLQSVRVIDSRLSHWVARGAAGRSVEWDAEVTHDEQDRELAWRSLPGADVDSEGVVRFQPLADGQSTQIRVEMHYVPPAGPLGATIARLFGDDPNRRIADELRRFKELMEGPASPQVPGVAGQGAAAVGTSASQGGIHTS